MNCAQSGRASGSRMLELTLLLAAGAVIAFDPNMRLRLWPSRAVMAETIMQAAAISESPDMAALKVAATGAIPMQK